MSLPDTRTLGRMVIAAQVAVAPATYAQEAPAPAMQPADASGGAEGSPGKRTHDGFYFRFAAGLGAFRGSFMEHTSLSHQIEFSERGPSYLGGLALGATPFSGLVIGGGYGLVSTINTTHTRAGVESPGQRIGSMLVGPFVDYYPWPHEGFHVQLVAGLALAGIHSEGHWADFEGLGYGLMGGLGYEFWVFDQWSFGGMALMFHSRTVMNASTGVREVEGTMFVPGFALGGTYH